MDNSREHHNFESGTKSTEDKQKLEVSFDDTSQIEPVEIKQADSSVAEKISAVRGELAKGTKDYLVHREQIFKELPRVVTARNSGNRPLFKRWFQLGLAALGLTGASKLEAQTTNDVDKAAVKGSGTNITEVAKSPENTEGPFVYEQKSWDIKPEVKKAAAERLQKGSGGSSVFTVPSAKEYTPPAPTKTPENIGPTAKQGTERIRQNVNVRNEREDRGYRREPLIEINTQKRPPVSDEVLRLDKNGRWVRERRLGS